MLSVLHLLELPGQRVCGVIAGGGIEAPEAKCGDETGAEEEAGEMETRGDIAEEVA